MAEQKLLKLTISKVDAPVFDGEVISVYVPGVTGDMEILAGHTALISPLKQGTLVVKKTDGQETFEIDAGTLEISNNHATILI
ncbi:F0F1 ATP synthase subunit epsilon [Candidatus Pacebacteria bacterium]|nr:F0F1 ATP synthase subunit epsilon [Candidatus Paceibacterota bacterium]